MNAAQSGQGVLEGSVVLETVTPAYTPLIFTEAQNFGQNFLGPLKIPWAIVLNFSLNGYSTLADLLYFCLSDISLFPQQVQTARTKESNNQYEQRQ